MCVCVCVCVCMCVHALTRTHMCVHVYMCVCMTMLFRHIATVGFSQPELIHSFCVLLTTYCTYFGHTFTHETVSNLQSPTYFLCTQTLMLYSSKLDISTFNYLFFLCRSNPCLQKHYWFLPNRQVNIASSI